MKIIPREAISIFFREAISLAGFVSAFYGVYQIHQPAAYIAGGVFCVWVTSHTRKKDKVNK